jgi:hypothetical protein
MNTFQAGDMVKCTHGAKMSKVRTHRVYIVEKVVGRYLYVYGEAGGWNYWKFVKIP